MLQSFLNSGYTDFEKYKEHKRNKRKLEKTRKTEYIKSKKEPCLFCGSDENIEMHHKNPNEKDGLIYKTLSTRSYKTIDEEIDKCWWLCKSCHQKLHQRLCDPLPQCYD